MGGRDLQELSGRAERAIFRDGKGLLEAMRRTVAGRQKQIACEVYPTLAVPSAESRLSRVLSGELAIPAALFDTIVANPGAEPLLQYLETASRPDPLLLRREALRLLQSIQEGTERATEMLERAAAADRQGREVA